MLKSDGQVQKRSKQRFLNQGSSIALRVENDRFSNPRLKGGYIDCSNDARPNCAKYGRKHDGKCIVGSDGWYIYGKSGDHKLRDFSNAQG